MFVTTTGRTLPIDAASAAGVHNAEYMIPGGATFGVEKVEWSGDGRSVTATLKLLEGAADPDFYFKI
jgi:hypothetical protein